MKRIMVLACALLPALTATAHAATVVPGGTITDQVWTPAGSPYRLEGDVTVAAGSTLTIAAGTVVELATGDSQAAGLDPARIELTVNGRLRIEGTGQDQVPSASKTSTMAAHSSTQRGLAPSRLG